MNWQEIIIHHTAAPAGEKTLQTPSIRRYHTRDRGWKDIGYHFVLEPFGDGFEVLLGRPLSEAGAHCPGKNHTAIGFAFAGDYSRTAPPQAMLRTAAHHLAGICSVFQIPAHQIKAHRDYRSTLCPGFPLDRLREWVEERL